ncbi:MAG: prolipoprotein diacylglyceryl transferase [Chloroflexota bacterium]
MYPELIQIGGWTLRSYSLITELGVIVGIIVAYKVARRQGLSPETFFDITIWTVIAGIVGSRLYYVAVAWGQERFYEEPIRIVYSWEGGLVLQGALVGAVIAIIILVWIHHVPFMLIGDIVAVGMSLGHAIGRWADFLNGCCYGQLTDLPFGVQFPLLREPVRPTMIYESLANLAIFLALWKLDKRKPFLGFTLCLYLISYSTVRFLVEFLRGDSAEMILGLRLVQWASLVTIVGAGLLLLYLRRTATQAPSAPTPPTPEASDR